MSVPAVSVVMAAYNGAALLPATLASLEKQTFGDFELVVVDDCSTDRTVAVLEAWGDPRLRLVRAEQNGGPVRARNRAVVEAKGRYIAGLDQDDLCHPDRFARQVAWLDANPCAVALGTAAMLLVDDRTRSDIRVAQTSPATIGWLLRIGNPLIWSSMMIRGEAARSLDPFTRPEMLYAEDFDLYHRLLELGEVARLDDELTIYRSHSAGVSQRHADVMYGNAAKVLAGHYAHWVGDDAGEASLLVARHAMANLPVPDAATFEKLGGFLTALLAGYIDEAHPDPDSLRLIQWETARRWARIGQKALRSGHISLRDLVTTRPAHLGLGYVGPDALLMSGAIGGARGLSRRRA